MVISDLALRNFDMHLVCTQGIEYKTEVLLVFFWGFGENEDIIEIDNHKLVEERP
jgi:hypothetical protein